MPQRLYVSSRISISMPRVALPSLICSSEIPPPLLESSKPCPSTPVHPYDSVPAASSPFCLVAEKRDSEVSYTSPPVTKSVISLLLHSESSTPSLPSQLMPISFYPHPLHGYASTSYYAYDLSSYSKISGHYSTTSTTHCLPSTIAPIPTACSRTMPMKSPYYAPMSNQRHCHKRLGQSKKPQQDHSESCMAMFAMSTTGP